MADFFENTDTSTSDDQEVPKFGDGFDSSTRLTAKKVAEEAGVVFKYFDEKLKKFEPEINDLTNKVTEQEKELKIARTDNSKSLAVFVAFFTFISISFSILPRITHPVVLLGTLLVLLGSLTFFVLLLAWIMDIQREKLFTNKQKIVGILAVVLLVIGFTTAWLGYNSMKEDRMKEIEELYTQKEIDQLLMDQKDLIRSEINSIDNSDHFLTKFKACIATRGLSACIVE